METRKEPTTDTFAETKALMDRFYRLERHRYDRSRKFYLWGRDTLLEKINLPPAGSLLEVGCGTSRNLIKLAHLHSTVQLYGLDASSLMLKTAEKKVRRQCLENRITLKLGVAESWDYATDFGLQESLDVVVFSYVLSMITDWKGAIETALRNLKPGGRIYAVDFGDYAGTPAWYHAIYKMWFSHLSRNHGYNRLLELPDHFRLLEKAGQGHAEIIEVGRGHANLVIFTPAF